MVLHRSVSKAVAKYMPFKIPQRDLKWLAKAISKKAHLLCITIIIIIIMTKTVRVGRICVYVSHTPYTYAM